MTRKKKVTGTDKLYAQARKVGLHYVGKNNAHFTGIPADDIDPMQVSLIGQHRIEAVMASGLYEMNEVNDE